MRAQPTGAERHAGRVAVVHAPAAQQQLDEPSPQRTFLRIIAAEEELGRPNVKSGAAKNPLRQVALGFAGFILVKFMFPALLLGENPILVGLIGSSAIMFVVLYAAHGLSARTTTALVGTLFGLILTARLGRGATRWAPLTGVAAVDDVVLAAAAPHLSLKSVVMCGIIIAGLGVLNDGTNTQASAMWELADGEDRPGPHPSRRPITQAMRIGNDHIASTVYTIAFATVGATPSVRC